VRIGSVIHRIISAAESSDHIQEARLGAVQASDSGSWSCAPSAPLADGAYTLTATATDAMASPVTSPPVQVTVQG
jgi:hypothetical protein